MQACRMSTRMPVRQNPLTDCEVDNKGSFRCIQRNNATFVEVIPSRLAPCLKFLFMALP